MTVGVQFTGTLPAGATRRWFTHSWPQGRHVVWYVVPTSPQVGGAQIEWDVAVERASAANLTYWVTIKNLTSNPVNIEARYAILN
ncbi:hypothetical protein J5X98_22470 [Leptothermofonsia sichuanensis E412]|uniref:hypothetical protein n=1 Tax=Leptothermofonsia sichuanensis TaxID=2917832 RepID=UPI001CA763BF|nr:hypothetical protein [Leptothermofonsia sichuanensis]QZZ20026.1 hypothetical protein J5X98_22470 [Leptothermofonsia sichuanensis E412]